MAAPIRRPNWVARQARSHRIPFVAAIACAVVLVVAIAALTGVLRLGPAPSHGSGPSESTLNPHSEKIVAIDSQVNYTGNASGYFAALDNTELCGPVCPELPRVYTNYSVAEIAIYFFVNVTNAHSSSETLQLPTLGTSGPNASLFQLQMFCCYTNSGRSYNERLSSALPFAADQAIGLEGYAYTVDPIPYSSAGGYTLYLNSTSP